MTTTKIDRSGTSQSVRLPDGFQFDVDEAEILSRGDEVILRKKQTNLRCAFAGLRRFQSLPPRPAPRA
jgi:antitoxin VapB